MCFSSLVTTEVLYSSLLLQTHRCLSAKQPCCLEDQHQCEDHFLQIAPCSFLVLGMLILSSGGPLPRIWPNCQLLISKSFLFFTNSVPSHRKPPSTSHRDLHPGANPPRALREVQPLASPAPGADIQETLPSERAESSVGGGGKRGHGGIPQPDRGSSRDPGRATASGAPPQTIADPAGQRSARSHTSADPSDPSPARTRTGSPDAAAAQRSPPSHPPGATPDRTAGDAGSADSRGRGLREGAGLEEAGPRGGWGQRELVTASGRNQDCLGRSSACRQESELGRN